MAWTINGKQVKSWVIGGKTVKTLTLPNGKVLAFGDVSTSTKTIYTLLMADHGEESVLKDGTGFTLSRYVPGKGLSGIVNNREEKTLDANTIFEFQFFTNTSLNGLTGKRINFYDESRESKLTVNISSASYTQRFARGETWTFEAGKNPYIFYPSPIELIGNLGWSDNTGVKILNVRREGPVTDNEWHDITYWEPLFEVQRDTTIQMRTINGVSASSKQQVEYKITVGSTTETFHNCFANFIIEPPHGAVPVVASSEYSGLDVSLAGLTTDVYTAGIDAGKFAAWKAGQPIVIQFGASFHWAAGGNFITLDGSKYNIGSNAGTDIMSGHYYLFRQTKSPLDLGTTPNIPAGAV